MATTSEKAAEKANLHYRNNMDTNPTLLNRITGFFRGKPAAAPTRKSMPVPPTGGRKSIPTFQSSVLEVANSLQIISPGYVFEAIPVIRKLILANPDYHQAYTNIISLGNTGHKIKFDPNIKPDDIDKMRKHCQDVSKNWATGTAGIHGLVNKMMGQIMVGGALSIEAPPNNKLDGIESVILVNPETIRWAYDKGGKYKPLQKISGTLSGIEIKEKDKADGSHIELNPLTFKYYALNGDTEIPYGIPPYIAGFDSLATQRNMMDNIKFIVEQVGLMGFLQVLVEKPQANQNESDGTYNARMETYLEQAKTRLEAGMRDGITVGFTEETEFNFHNPTKNAAGVVEIFKENEMQLLSALHQDGALMGRDYGSSESQIAIVFMKMLSELVNVQALCKEALEWLYTFELRLKGFNFDYLSVDFNKSTLMDELKYQQSQEIKIRNVQSKYNMGIISQDQAADELGYEAADEDKPRVEVDLAGKAIDKAARADQKGKSEKKGVRKKSSSDPTGPSNRTRKGSPKSQ